jgi:hypothetical protein
MEDTAWHTNQLDKLEDNIWYLQQFSRILQEFREDIGGIWNDQAARALNKRYCIPHEEDCTEILFQIDKQYNSLIKLDEKIKSAFNLSFQLYDLSTHVQKLIEFANEDIKRAHSSYGIYAEEFSQTNEQLPIVENLIKRANSIC